MSDLGPLAYRKPGNSFENDRAHVLSEATAQRVDEEIRKVVIEAYDRAKSIVERNRLAVDMMAKALLEEESLEADDIRELMVRAEASL
jgi:cell division protease FtsH